MESRCWAKWAKMTDNTFIYNCLKVYVCVLSLISSKFDYRGSLIARFMGPTWGPSGTDRSQVGPMLAPWTLLSGLIIGFVQVMDLRFSRASHYLKQCFAFSLNVSHDLYLGQIWLFSTVIKLRWRFISTVTQFMVIICIRNFVHFKTAQLTGPVCVFSDQSVTILMKAKWNNVEFELRQENPLWIGFLDQDNGNISDDTDLIILMAMMVKSP